MAAASLSDWNAAQVSFHRPAAFGAHASGGAGARPVRRRQGLQHHGAGEGRGEETAGAAGAQASARLLDSRCTRAASAAAALQSAAGRSGDAAVEAGAAVDVCAADRNGRS